LLAPEIGFTGTQEGMSEKQRSSLRQVLASFFADGARVFRHGDCVGADAQAHAKAKAAGFRVVIHPPSDDSKRAFCQGDAVLTPRPYLVRNRHIVDASSVLIATPKGDDELRSGTWSTIRYARKVRRDFRIRVITP
jgi:hypothetical protein